MNPRVLELLKNPKNIQSEDLGLLKEEIHAFPYVQNIRALHLFGVHLYDKENYQKELSTTAAYTTDKKILYQLINGKIRQEVKSEVLEDKESPKTEVKTVKYTYKTKAFPIKREQPSEIPQNKYEAVASMIPPVQDIKHIHVNGERNRILFEGEENFLEDKNSETIDLESTLESGVLVTQKSSPATEEPKEKIINEQNSEENEQQEDIDTEGGVKFTPELIVDEDKIASKEEKQEIDKAEDISFHEVETEKEEQPEDTEAGLEFTPELMIDEDKIASKEEKQEIDKAEDISFHEVEAEKEEQPENIEAGLEFTPELIVDEDKIDTQTEEKEIDKAEDISFHEVEELTPEKEDTEKEKQAVEESMSAETEQHSTEVTKDQNADQPDAEISFHGMDQFLPDVKIQANSDDTVSSPEVSKPNVNKHEEEMRRLIEEVEKKMKEAQATPKIENKEPEITDHEISFAETQNFHFWSTEKEEPKAEQSAPVPVQEIVTEPELPIEPVEIEAKAEQQIQEQEPAAERVSSWKPMSLDAHLPDSMISKENTVPVTKTEAPQQQEAAPAEIVNKKIEEPAVQAKQDTETHVPVAKETAGITEEEKENERENSEQAVEPKTPKREEAPVMNVSFFGTDISSLSVKKAEKEKIKQDSAHEVKAENQGQVHADSNVPGFINTWQSWLKIDRPSEKDAVIVKEEVPIQEKVIEAFIENNPRISQLRDESTYVVKEKNDDISHLMTETLANLYFEQKLYTKAIKAFEILIKKTPEKKEYFQAKIQEIKDFRSKG
ncbi:hypothetical protein [Chryseobacterium sp. W4I1]|uniref:hypothetical protein n=1 Tax=Chryseobacterium sp. W4I1 TaxID=3042293 RepID=UPI002784668E|nr:hypothetical protein [Chryseobacterium sp. W4I1]MDQ0783669.1 hypothetical protein [Chryseobacterium sp. W4I1]